MAFHRNWIGFFEVIPAYLDTARSWYSDGVFFGVTGLQLSVFNAAIVEDPHRLTEDRIARIDQAFAAMQLPYSIQVYSETMIPDFAPLLHSLGYAEIFTDPLMVHRSVLDLSGAEPNPNVRVTSVQTAEDEKLYCDLVVRGFDLIGASAVEFLHVLLKMRENFHIIGWLEDQPVGAGTVSLCGGEAGVYNVTTLPWARRQGVAMAMMNALHSFALQNGFPGTALAASNMGVPLYERLGYAPDGYQIAYVPLATNE